MVHVSRLSEELIIWMSQNFGFIDIADRFCTGSSIMPQKKNPDVPELARGKTGRVVGHLMGLITLMKGQPWPTTRTTRKTRNRCSTPWTRSRTRCASSRTVAHAVRQPSRTPVTCPDPLARVAGLHASIEEGCAVPGCVVRWAHATPWAARHPRRCARRLRATRRAAGRLTRLRCRRPPTVGGCLPGIGVGFPGAWAGAAEEIALVGMAAVARQKIALLHMLHAFGNDFSPGFRTAAMTIRAIWRRRWPRSAHGAQSPGRS